MFSDAVTSSGNRSPRLCRRKAPLLQTGHPSSLNSANQAPLAFASTSTRATFTAWPCRSASVPLNVAKLLCAETRVNAERYTTTPGSPYFLKQSRSINNESRFQNPQFCGGVLGGVGASEQSIMNRNRSVPMVRWTETGAWPGKLVREVKATENLSLPDGATSMRPPQAKIFSGFSNPLIACLPVRQFATFRESPKICVSWLKDDANHKPES